MDDATFVNLFDLQRLTEERWPVIPGLGDAAVLRCQRIQRLYPGVADLYISPMPYGRLKKDIVCWDAGAAVLLWLVGEPQLASTAAKLD